MKTFFDIKLYGDYDIPVLYCIVCHEDKFSKQDLLNEFYSMKGIESTGYYDSDDLREITYEFVDFLISKGFQKIKTETIIFSD